MSTRVRITGARFTRAVTLPGGFITTDLPPKDRTDVATWLDPETRALDVEVKGQTPRSYPVERFEYFDKAPDEQAQPRSVPASPAAGNPGGTQAPTRSRKA